MNFIQSFFHFIFNILIWKYIIKRLIRLIKGTHEIERMLSNQPISYALFIQLMEYLSNSIQLSNLTQSIREGKILSGDEIEELVKKIIKIKHIKNSEAISETLEKILNKRNRLLKYKSTLSKLYQEQIDLSNEEHKELLFSIWTHFKKDEPIELVDRKWMNVGFQGKDPLTDFRGTGLLGLKHLSLFSNADLRANLIYKVASNQQTWYFYCATSINITGKVIEYIEKGNCDEFLFELKEKISMFDFTYKLYGDFFSGFNKMWVELKCTDFMEVNSLLEQFMDTRADEIYEKTLYGPKFY